MRHRDVVFDSETHRQAITIRKLQVGCCLRPLWRSTVEEGELPVVRATLSSWEKVSTRYAYAALDAQVILDAVYICRSSDVAVNADVALDAVCRSSDAAIPVRGITQYLSILCLSMQYVDHLMLQSMQRLHSMYVDVAVDADTVRDAELVLDVRRCSSRCRALGALVLSHQSLSGG